MDFAEQVKAVEVRLDALLPAAAEPPQALHEAMRYAVFTGGKRLRPLLCLNACAAVGGEQAACLSPACALEMMHAFSLIHDDLPCMDDDELRRGKPTCHVVYGQSTALLAGDALAILAFEVLADSAPPLPFTAGDLVRELAAATGHAGMVGGQAEDLEGEQYAGTEGRRLLERIHRKKTAAFIRAAIRTGAMLGGCDERQLACLAAYGEDIGLAFQIVDDILNVTGTPEELGKAVGSDSTRGKLTYPAVYGLAESRRCARDLVQRGVERLAGLASQSAGLVELGRLVVERRT
ncbi:MAG: polyprenyl synthetase family protein [Kiritimatiellae bacterium]|nr:polyprenyl synthetase family protein [Kiritimatiellia bacterium]